MKRNIKNTADGSKTLFIENWEEGYHSHHGALQEAQHVFIDNGLMVAKQPHVNILELGFGTGLNVLVTAQEFLKTDDIQSITYFGIEKYPVSKAEIVELGYDTLFEMETLKSLSYKIHETQWEQSTEILKGFNLTKLELDFYKLPAIEMPKIDLVYFDCFGARVQPDLWESPLLSAVADKMRSGGLFTTYSSKGSVRRILKDLGFEVEKVPGPKGKREMINAIKK